MPHEAQKVYHKLSRKNFRKSPAASDRHAILLNMQRRHILFIALGCVALVGGIWWGVTGYRAARQRADAARLVAERKAFLARFGIYSDGTREFVALPMELIHNAVGARLGQSLFIDRRVARSPYRVCGACHRLNEGGIDARALGGILPRTVYNAVFADVFLHDGSITGYPALVRHMLESPDFCAGGPLSNIVTRLATDEQLSNRFKMAYTNGLTEATLLDAFAQHQRTLFSPARTFDHWCDGQTNALSKTQSRGFDVFRLHKCTDCHYGPALGTLKVVEGKKVPGLRGLSHRRAYLPDATTNLNTVIMRMPGGDIKGYDRHALADFLKIL